MVKCFKLQKLLDIFGVAAEYLKLASPLIINIMQHITNKCISEGKLPHNFKIGSICPMQKKTKPPKSLNNYKRITITAPVGKFILDPEQCRLQFSFTCSSSSIYAVLVLTGVMAEATDDKQELLITFMYISKVFNEVSHTSMFNALHEQGVTGNLWKLYDSMYTSIQCQVKWRGHSSSAFPPREPEYPPGWQLLC